MEYIEEYQLQIEKFREALGCDIMALALVQPAENLYVLKWQYISGNISERIKKVVLQSGKGIAGGVFKSGKPLMVPNVSEFASKDDLFNYPILRLEKLQSVGATPLWHSGRVVGVLLGGYRESNLMTTEKLQLLISMSKSGLGKLDGKELLRN
ncbi:nitrogen regulatory protein A [Planomicrobium stackebrandtii]|uniref:Nitrogen regulatory protein A n=1 Tax=Planomicrobium stackebrandtii TaxID=253160 RepID=A0ABU0GQH1_9BACL|nr:GAF domain-containing protein [Planomicrobium stackebrandtii]MDQ0427224.1 nitrogen regulatory protein A [Planomicrobium stackebrandtii]